MYLLYRSRLGEASLCSVVTVRYAHHGTPQGLTLNPISQGEALRCSVVSPCICRFGQFSLKHSNFSFDSPWKTWRPPQARHFTSTALSTRSPLKRSLLQVGHRYSLYTMEFIVCFRSLITNGHCQPPLFW